MWKFPTIILKWRLLFSPKNCAKCLPLVSNQQRTNEPCQSVRMLWSSDFSPRVSVPPFRVRSISSPFLRMTVPTFDGLQKERIRYEQMETPIRRFDGKYFKNLGKNVAKILSISKPSSVSHIQENQIAMFMVTCFQFEITY